MLNVIKDNYLVEEITGEETTEAGVIIPDAVSKGGVNKGIIKAVGTNDDLNLILCVDAKIFFKKHLATEIKHEGETYFVVNIKNIIAVM